MEEKYVAKFQNDNAGARPGGKGHAGWDLFNSHGEEPSVSQSEYQITGYRRKQDQPIYGIKVAPG